MSATTRMVLDSVRTLVIWTVSLSLHWQKFYWPQVSSIFFVLLHFSMSYALYFYLDIRLPSSGNWNVPV